MWKFELLLTKEQLEKFETVATACQMTTEEYIRSVAWSQCKRDYDIVTMFPTEESE